MRKKKRAIQVTSNNNSDKIKHTIDEFIRNGIHKKCDSLKILILTSKKKYTTLFETNGLFEFDPKKDIIDIDDLIKEIYQFPIDKLKEINDFLYKEFVINQENKAKTEASEIDTIIDLIEFISAHKKIEISMKGVVDPEFKINKRFHEFAEGIKENYAELYMLYKKSLSEIEEKLGDEAQDIVVKFFLQDISIEYLKKANNNPLDALENLTEFFMDKLSVNRRKYDRTAIKFYLMDKMIECNVFPNEGVKYNVSQF